MPRSMVPLRYLKIFFIAVQCSKLGLLVYLLNLQIAQTMSSLVQLGRYIEDPII